MKGAPTQSEQCNEIFAALCKAQSIVLGSSKDKINPLFNSKYSDLFDTWQACREAVTSEGMCISQTVVVDVDGQMYLQTLLGHTSGQWIKSFIEISFADPIRVDKDGRPKKVNLLQEFGSSMTYLRRYGLAAMVGVCPTEDDDGNSVTSYAPKNNNKLPPLPPAQPQRLQTNQLPPVSEETLVAEIATFIDSSDRPDFLEWFDKLINSKKWSVAEGLASIKRDISHTKTMFEGWKASKAGV